MDTINVERLAKRLELYVWALSRFKRNGERLDRLEAEKQLDWLRKRLNDIGNIDCDDHVSEYLREVEVLVEDAADELDPDVTVTCQTFDTLNQLKLWAQTLRRTNHTGQENGHSKKPRKNPVPENRHVAITVNRIRKDLGKPSYPTQISIAREVAESDGCEISADSLLRQARRYLTDTDK